MKVRTAFSVSLGLLLAEQVSESVDLPIDDTPALIGMILFQVADRRGDGVPHPDPLLRRRVGRRRRSTSFAGLQSAAMFDPAQAQHSGPMSRMFGVLAGLVLFGTGGHLLLVGGFARTFEAAPVSGLRLDRLGLLITHDLGEFMMATLQIGAPGAGRAVRDRAAVGPRVEGRAAVEHHDRGLRRARRW